MDKVKFYYEKPAILSDIPVDNHALIEASAGTGKTYTIEHLIVELLMSGRASVDEILIVTFTVRATADLKRRIRQLLVTIIDGYKKAKRANNSVASRPDVDHWVIDEKGFQNLHRALFNFDSAPIYTIHGFCQRVLSDHAFQNHRLFNERHLPADDIFQEVFLNCVRREFALDDELSKYLTAWLETAGKSLDDLSKLLKKCVSTQAQIWPEIKGDVTSLGRVIEGDHFQESLRTELKLNKVNGRTITASLKHLRACLDVLFPVQSPEETVDIVEILANMPVKSESYLKEKFFSDDEKTGWWQGDCIDKVRSFLEAIIPFEAYVVQKFLPVVQEQLRRKKDEEGVFSFDDMLSMVWESLSEGQSDELLVSLRRRYRYALIDEFQDTDALQWNIFRKIFHESQRASIVYLIGDPKQAIYSFRNADIYTYFQAKDDILKAGGKCVELSENYRSTRDVIDAYNTILEQHGEEGFFTGEIRYDNPVTPGAQPPVLLAPGTEECSANAHDDVATLMASPANDALKPLQVFRCDDAMLESLNAQQIKHLIAQQFAKEIKAILDDPPILYYPANPKLDKPARTRKICAKDIYCLTRSGAEGHIIAQHLSHYNVPYAFYREEGLFQAPEAQDIADILAAIEDIENVAKRIKAWHTPFFGLTLADIYQCRYLPETDPLHAVFIPWRELAVGQNFERLFDRLTYDSGLVRRELFFHSSERKLTNYLHIFEILLAESKRENLTLRELCLKLQGFIEKRALPEGEDGNIQRLESEQDAVQIMTMHKSKGLEADIVFVFGGFSKSPFGAPYSFHNENHEPVFYIASKSTMLPELVHCMEADEKQEDQRLLYVALTRARAQLYLPCISNDIMKVNGTYEPLNNRLLSMVSDAASHESISRYISQHHIVAPGDENTESLINHTQGQDKAVDWSVFEALSTDESLRAILFDGAKKSPLEERFESLRKYRQVITSFSQLKNTADVISYVASDMNLEHERIKGDALMSRHKKLPPDHLPGSIVTGNFLHTVLETVDLGLVSTLLTLDDWLQDTQVHEVFDDCMQQYGISPRYEQYAKTIIYHTLRSPVVMPGGHAIKLADLKSYKHELEFIYPIPETFHPTVAVDDITERPAFKASRGYIKGYIDFIFESGDQVYFADWKSNILTHYDKGSVRDVVRRKYSVQSVLYTLAVMKLLKIDNEKSYNERFGGCFYFFLRGMHCDKPGEGVDFQRPTWADITAYQKQLLVADYR